MIRSLLLSRILLAICFVVVSSSTTLRAAEGTNEGDHVFRRLFVPADAPESWPVGSERFLPISREDFSRLIKPIATLPTGKHQPAIYVSQALYRAKLLPDNVLRGTTEWTVELTGKQPKLLPLTPLNLAILSASWHREPNQKVSLGLWKREGSSSDNSKDDAFEWAVLAEQSDTLLMQWQLAARKIDSAGILFDLQKPLVIPQTLELDLPANHSATLTHAQLLRTDSGPLGENRWVFQLAPRETHRLRIKRSSPVESTQALPFLSQVTSYQLEPSGLNVRTQLRLDARETTTSELKAALPSGLRVVEVRMDSQPVAWRVVDVDVAAAEKSILMPTLIISRPESRQPQSLEIRCLAKFRPDIRWELPRLRFNEVAWTEGTTSLLVSPDLELRSLTPRQATLQHIVGIADLADEGEVFRLQEWSQEAAIEIEVGRPQPHLSAQTLTTLELGYEESQANIDATLASSGSDIYQIQATVAAGWSIDSLTATPKSTLNEWHINREGNTAKLYVQLNQPISAQRPLRLTIKASETTGESLLPATIGQLKILRFLKSEITHELLQLRTRELKQVVLVDHLERARLALADVPLELRSQIPESPVGTFLDVALLDEDEVLEFRQQPAQYQADVQIEVVASPDSLKQHYQIGCQLRLGVVSELVLEFEAPLPKMEWVLVGQKGLVTIERLNDEAGERPTYVLRLPVAMTDDFQLQASYSQPARPQERCNLLRLPQSLDWNGQVLLRGSLVGLHVLDQGWTPTVASTDQTAKQTRSERLPVLGTYRWDTEEFRRNSTKAGLRIQRQTAPLATQQLPVPQLFAWLAEYHTLQAASGAAIHTVHYSLENLGQDEAQITLPPGAELQEAWLNDQQLDLKQLAADGNVYQFRFSRELHWPYLALKYTTQEPPLSGLASLQPVVPKSSFLVNLGRWTLWSPEQYEIEGTQHADLTQRIPWWKRLFGPFARSPSETLFNPTSSASWSQLWSSSRATRPKQQASGNLTNRPNDRLVTYHGQSANISCWRRSSSVKNPLWNSPVAITFAGVRRRVQTVEFVDDLPTLTVRRAYVQRAFWHGLVLLTVVLGVWQFAHFPHATIFAGALAGAACLILSAQWLIVPQAVFLGLIAAALVRVAMKSARLVDALPSSRKGVQLTAMILLSCLCGSPVQSQPLRLAASRQDLPRVLVPIDSQGRPQGEDVYLTEAFLKKLQHAPQRAVNDGAELVLLTANYSGSLPGELEPRLTDPWTLRWKVESFVPNCRLHLPLRRDEAQWDETAHRLDGVPVKLEWLSEGNGCFVTLPATGVHWLQLVAQPRFAVNDRSAKLQWHLPPLSGATLDLSLAPKVNHVQIPGAFPTANSSAFDRWHGMLGAKELLELHWTSKTANNNATTWERLEQSAWLHVDPAAARLEVQLSLTGVQSTSLLLDLEVSAQLQLEQPGENSPIEAVIVPSPGQPNRLQLKLRPGLPADLIIPLRFELQREVSVGRIFFPRVRLLESPPAQNLFAVSVSAGLSYDEQVSSDLRSIEPADFSRSWHPSAEEPLYAYAMGPAAPEWSLRVWPDPQSLTAQQSLRVSCLPNKAQVHFEAAIDELTGAWLSHRLEVPESMEIETITVRDTFRDSAETNFVPVRWSRVSATEAVVFLSRPLRHAHLLQLQGHVLATKKQTIELPQVRLLRSERSEIHLDLYRTEEVQVSWSDPQRAPEEFPESRLARSNEEILVGHFSWRSSQASELSSLCLERNDPEFETASVTTVHSDPAGWTARLNSQLLVREGIVSRLSLTAPDSFRPPFVLQPEQVGVIDEVRNTPDGNELIVLLTEPVAAGDRVELRLSGSLSLPADQRLAIPSLAWNGAAQRERYVLLPKYAQQQSLRWQTTGLRRQEIPPQLTAYAPEGETVHSLRLEQNQFEAKERTYRGALSNAVVRSAKVSGILDAEGGLTATAELILQPGRATSCAIQLPAKSQLIQLVIGDRPVRRELREDGSWKMPIGPPFMPQRIFVNYRSYPELVGDRLRLVPPKILIGDQALPTPQAWWRIRTLQGLQLEDPYVGRHASEIEFVKNSYEQPRTVLKEALSQALDLPREEGRAWSQTWQMVVRPTELAWQALRQPESISADRFTTEETPLGITATLAAAFAAEKMAPADRASPLTYPPSLPVRLEISPQRKEYFLVSDSRGQLVVAVSRGAQENLWRWFAATALLCGTLAVVLQLRLKPNWHVDLCRWPHSFAFAGGIAWWLLLNPSAIGMLVIVLALMSLALKKWRSVRRHPPEEPSTQLAVPTS